MPFFNFRNNLIEILTQNSLTPAEALWYFAITILLLTKWFDHLTFDFLIHNTYLVASLFHIGMLYAGLAVTQGIIYNWFGFQFRDSPGFLLHIMLTLISCLILIGSGILTNISNEEYEFSERYYHINLYGIVIYLFAQLVFVLNIVYGLRYWRVFM